MLIITINKVDNSPTIIHYHEHAITCGGLIPLIGNYMQQAMEVETKTQTPI